MLRAAARVRDRGAFAGFHGADHALELLRRGDGLPVDRGDDVAAGRELLPAHSGGGVGSLEAGVRGRAAGGHLRHLHAGRQAELGGQGVGDRGDADAEVGVLDLAGGEELRDDRLDRVGRNGEADAVVSARVALDLRVDADHLRLEVEERAARVAVVDRGVGLDRIKSSVLKRLNMFLSRFLASAKLTSAMEAFWRKPA